MPLTGRRGWSSRASGRWNAAKGRASLERCPVAARAPTEAAADAERLEQSGSLCTLLDASGEWISILDLQGRILSINEGGRKALLRKNISCRPGDDWAAFWAGEARTEAGDAVRSAAAGKSVRLIARRLDPDGTVSWWDIVVSPMRGADGAKACVAAMAREVTDQKVAEERLRWAANHDPLTMLPNRMFFQRQLDEAIAKAAASPGSFGLLLLDLDGFNWVDETIGIEAEKALMGEIASRLGAGIRRDDFVARLGDNEFALILGSIVGEEDLTAVAEAISDRLNAPFFCDSRRLECQIVMGGSIFPQHGPGRLELMKNARIALKAAKATERGNPRIFEAAMRSEAQCRNSMLSLAEYALRENRMEPYYQPKVDLRNGTLYGFEALLRWRHPRLGTQLPDTIKAAFQDDRLAVAISDRMIELVLRDMRRWIDRGLAFGHVAVNAAAAEFKRGDFAERLLAQLDAAGIPPALLQLEVTESVFLGRGSEHVVQALKTMSAAGIQIALDDFGTGFASLSHLKQFPVNTLKIDRSFVRDLHEDTGDEAIVRAIVGLGRSLGVSVVAEGIETPAQSAYLRKHLCAYGQGYLFGAAEAAGSVPAIIEKFDRRARAQPRIAATGALPVSAPMGGPARAPEHGNIYIVDDDCEVRNSTRFLLETMGYRCRTFASGADFLRVLFQLQPGCILLDVRMAGLSGFQVLRELKWMNLAWPVIVITGDLSGSTGASAMAAGAYALVAKPFDEVELQGILARALQALIPIGVAPTRLTPPFIDL
ncbi:MAG TPA: EAL domain-containing protein [Allosphingosinicella sp.]|nr:EAL domain-containing protein [Allosphingosinicella sp.]